MSDEKDSEKIEEKNEIQHKPSKKIDFTKKLRQNPWIPSTFILGIVVVILITGNIFGGMTGKVVSSTNAGNTLVEYLNQVAASEVTLVKAEDEGNMYLVTVGFKGEEIPVYVTKDGKYYTMSLLPIITSSSTTQTQENIQKSDTPKIELFIWSYCPYGVQALGPLAEVALLLGDSAEISVIPYYDGHGEYETQQNKIQSCIQKLDKEKYWDYAKGFAEDIYTKCGSSRDIECDKEESIKLMNSLGIDSTQIMSCVDTRGTSLLEEYATLATNMGVTGSPTLMINENKVSPSSRTAEAFKKTICSSFNNAPEECETTLDSSTTTASGSC